MRTSLLFLLFFLSIYTAALASLSTGQIWTSDVHTRWRPNSAAPSSPKTSVTLYAARREYEPFQIVVRQNGTGSVTVTDFQLSDLVSSAGDRISASNINIYREMFVSVTRGSSKAPGTLPAGLFADPLIPLKDEVTGNRPSGSPQYKCVPATTTSSIPLLPFLVDIFVPLNTTSATYRGSISVLTDRGSQSISIQLNVWKFALPLKAYQQSAIGIWGPNENWIAQPFTQQMKNTFIMLLKHRLSPEKPSWHADVNGENAAVTLRDQYGLQTGSLQFFASANDCKLHRDVPTDSEVADYVKSMKDAGLMVYGHAFDEISECGSDIMTALKQWSSVYNRTGVNMMSVMSMNQALFGNVDVWVLAPSDVIDSTQRSLAAQRQAVGDKVWSYTALSLSYDKTPTWTIDQPATAYRLRPIMNFASKLTGLLYWTFAYWDASKPYENVYTYGDASNRNDCPGDGILMYPHGPIGFETPAPSYRMKLIREGMEDADYFQMMRKFNSSGAFTLARKVGGSWSSWSTSASTLRAVRLEVGSAIHAKNGGVTIKAEAGIDSANHTGISPVVMGIIVAAVVVAVVLGVILVYIFVIRRNDATVYGQMTSNTDS